MKPKHALVKDGFLPPGSENKRGRLSGPAIERLKELAGQGWSIDGYSVTVTDKAAPVVEKVRVESGGIVDVPDETRPEDSWEAYVNDKKIGMRTVCNQCHSSLTYCPCRFPRVWVDHLSEGVVVFKPRTTPIGRKNRW